MGSADDFSVTRGKDRLWTPSFLLVIAISFAFFLVNQGENSGMSVYLDRVGGTATLAGVGAAVFSIVAGLARIICGKIIDTRGRRNTLIAGSVFAVLGTAGPYVVSGVDWVVFWRVAQGVGFGAATTSAATVAADILPKSRLGEGIGYYGLGQALAMSVGPAIGLALVATDPPENLFLGLGCLSVLTLVLTVACNYEKHPDRLPATCAYLTRLRESGAYTPQAHISLSKNNGEGEAAAPASAGEPAAPPSPSPSPSPSKKAAGVGRRRSARARVLSFVDSFVEPTALSGAIPILVISPAFGYSIFFMGLYGTHLGVGAVGVYFTVCALSMLAVRARSGAYMNTAPPSKIMAVCTFSGVLGYAMLIAAGFAGAHAAAALFFAAGVPYGVCIGLGMPLCQTMAVKYTPPTRLGAANALYMLFNDVAVGLSSILWGALNDSIGFAPTMGIVAALIAASYFVSRAVFARAKATYGY